MRTLTAALALILWTGLACAQATPAGLWKTIDDDSGKEKSLVRITEAQGVYTGHVAKILNPDKADARCTACTDERKDQPVLGMTILRAVRADPADTSVFRGGDILDPNNGKTYQVRLKPIDGGKQLEVRGYIGAPLFGRTQTWIRVE
jgi:uncharacterized protein (DUF2147 family)